MCVFGNISLDKLVQAILHTTNLSSIRNGRTQYWYKHFMAPFKASPEFESAASYLTKGPSLVDTPNATKLEVHTVFCSSLSTYPNCVLHILSYMACTKF